MTTLIVSKTIHRVDVPLGRIEFNEKRQGKLTLTGTGADADALATAWAEVSSKSTLKLQRNVTEEIKGEKITKFLSQIVSPGDEDYPWAVMDNLQRKHGFTVTSPTP
jgi:hypothetical protein